MFKNAVMANTTEFPESSRLAKRKRGWLPDLVIVGIAALVPVLSDAGEVPKLYRSTRSFAMDSCQESKTTTGDKILKGCNFFVKNAADAALEIYDKNNLLIYYTVLAGARNTSNLLEGAFTDAYYKTAGWVFSEYPLDDFRNPGASLIPVRKTTITEGNIPEGLKIPQGGRLVVTQNSTKAHTYNYIQMGWELASKAIPVSINKILKIDIVETKFLLLTAELGGNLFQQDITTLSIKLASGMIDVAFESLKDNPEQLATLKPKLSNALSIISTWKLDTLAELGLFAINVKKTIMSLEEALTHDFSIVVENKLDSPPLKPIYRYADFDAVSAAYLVLLETEARLSFWPKNYAQFDQPEIFGVNDPLDRDEFLTSLRHLMKVNGHNVFASMDSFKAALKIKNATVDYTTNPISYAQAYGLVDAALKLGFDGYSYCTSLGGLKTKTPRTRLIEIVKQQHGFIPTSSQSAKNLFVSTVIDDNNETKGVMTRRQSLPLYYALNQAIKRGDAKCPTSH